MKKLGKKQTIVIILALVAVVAVAGFVVAQSFQISPNDRTATNDGDINFGPAGEAEKTETQQHKEDLATQGQQENQEPGSQAQKNQVTPIITSASQNGQQITVNAFVQGVVEEGGRCTLSVTRGTQKIVKTNNAFANSSTTDCVPFMIDRSEFSQSGEWFVAISYSSQSSYGTSAETKVNIQ